MPVKRRVFAHTRKVAGYSQEALAARLGVDRSTVARWEAEETTPQPCQRPRLADAFGLSLNELDQLLNDAGTTKRAGEEVDRDRSRHACAVISFASTPAAIWAGDLH